MPATSNRIMSSTFDVTNFDLIHLSIPNKMNPTFDDITYLKENFNKTEISFDAIMSPPLSANLQQQQLEQLEVKAYECQQMYNNSMQHYVPETPNSVFSDHSTIETYTQIDENLVSYNYNPATSTTTNAAATFVKEDVFRFEPEDIAKLTFNDNCSLTKQEQCDTPYTPQTPYTPYKTSNNISYQSVTHNNNNTNTNTSSMCMKTENVGFVSPQHFLGSNSVQQMNYDMEYINYDEINCQSKNQSPCSSPQLDPWMTLSVPQQEVQPQEQQQQTYDRQSPKLENTFLAEENIKMPHSCAGTTKLPSMTSTFGTPNYEPVYGYEHQQQQQQQEMNTPNFDHLPENYENSNILTLHKPNRDHKIIWTIDELDEVNDGLMMYDDFGYIEASQSNQSNTGNTVTNAADEKIINFFTTNEIAENDQTQQHDIEQFEEEDAVFLSTLTNVCENKPKAVAFSQQQIYPVSAAALTPTECFTSVTTVPQLSTACKEKQHQQQQQQLPESIDYEQPMVCLWTDCNEMFPNQAEFVAHIEKCHVDVKKGDDFSCFWLDCPRRYKPFNARYKLLIHMRVHSGEKPNKCPFPSCSKAFSRLENLKIHQRSHTGERPYGCQYKGCLKAFSNSSDRAKHQRTHYDTKPYACQLPGCTKRYTDPSSLRKHVKNHALRNANGCFGRRKSANNKSNLITNAIATTTTTTATTDTTTTKLRRHSESSLFNGNQLNANNVDGKLATNAIKANHLQHQQHQQQQQLELQPKQHIHIRQQRSYSCSEFPITKTIKANNEQTKCATTEYYVASAAATSTTTTATATATGMKSATNNNSMNFNELSNCIVTIEHNQNENSIVEFGSQRNLHATAENGKLYNTAYVNNQRTNVHINNNNNNNNDNNNHHHNNNNNNNNINQTYYNNNNKKKSNCQQEVIKNINQLNELQHLFSSNNNQIEENCNSSVDIHINDHKCTKPKTPTVDTDESNDRDDFVTLEYVKKLLSETMDDYMDDCSAVEVSHSDENFTVASKQLDETTQDFVNTFMDIDYLTSLI